MEFTHLPANQNKSHPPTRTPVAATPVTASRHSGRLQQLQRAIGNSTLARLVQRKLEISQPGDSYEQEADRVADQVMRMSDASTSPGRVQRKCAGCEEEERLQAKEIPGERVSPHADVGDLGVDSRPLDPSVRSFFEPRFGYAFDHVRIHDGARAAASAEAVNAQAYTVGQDIVFGAGRYAPDTQAGKTLLAHELTHVVQQGVASPADQGNSLSISNLGGSPLQRAPLPCTTRTSVDIYPINLPGSTRSISDDIGAINSTFCQCGIEINVLNGESWQTNVLDLDAPIGVLNSSGNTPSRELSEMLAYRPGGDVIHAYYVPALESPGLLAESVASTRFTPSLPDSLIVGDGAGAVPIIAAHELGHVLLNDGSHHPNRDNLMASGGINSGAGELEQPQCDKMP